MKRRISINDLRRKAHIYGLSIQHECGGFRLIKDHADVYPDSGICRVVPLRELAIFIDGIHWYKKKGEL
jgi:hypothetical protein